MKSGLHTQDIPKDRYAALVRSLNLPPETSSLTFNSNGQIVWTLQTDDDW